MGKSLQHDKFNSKIKMSGLSKGMGLKPLIADSQIGLRIHQMYSTVESYLRALIIDPLVPVNCSI